MKGLYAALPLVLAANTAAACGTATVSGLTVFEVWSQATISTSDPTALYLTIRNRGAYDDTLLDISTPVADLLVLHKAVRRPSAVMLTEISSLSVPTGTTKMLEPDGLRITLIDLAIPLETGMTFPVTLVFEKAGELVVEAEVMQRAAHAPSC